MANPGTNTEDWPPTYRFPLRKGNLTLEVGIYVRVLIMSANGQSVLRRIVGKVAEMNSEKRETTLLPAHEEVLRGGGLQKNSLPDGFRFAQGPTVFLQSLDLEPEEKKD